MKRTVGKEESSYNDPNASVGSTATAASAIPRRSSITIQGKQYSTGLTELSLYNMSLTDEDIVSLEYMTNLRSLSLRDNQISDLTPLSGLTK